MDGAGEGIVKVVLPFNFSRIAPANLGHFKHIRPSLPRIGNQITLKKPGVLGVYLMVGVVCW